MRRRCGCLVSWSWERWLAQACLDRAMTGTLATLTVLDRDGVERAVDLSALVGAMRSAYRSGVARTTSVPLRAVVSASGPHRVFGVMPAVSDSLGLFTTKVVAKVPAPSRPLIEGLMVALSTRTGAPLACIDAAAVTDVKCAAVTALVTDICARPDATTVGIVGSGALALCQVRGIASVRDITRWTVSSRNQDHAEVFAARVRGLLGPDTNVRVTGRAIDALTGHDVVCTATSATTPLVADLVVPTGTHVNCMGAHERHSRELPADTLARSVLVVEDRELAVAEAGDVHRTALDLTDLVTAEAGEFHAAPTVFSSTGHALADLLVTAHALRAALGCAVA